MWDVPHLLSGLSWLVCMQVGEDVVTTIRDGIPGAVLIEFPLSAHMTFIDDSVNYITTISKWLQGQKHREVVKSI